MSSILDAPINAVAEERSRFNAIELELDRFMVLSYPIEIVEEDGQFTASNPDLPGCASFGDTPDEAVAELRATRRLWIRGQLESGNSIPEPASYAESFSGKLVLRLPKTLHRSLHEEARQQNVSLNQYLVYTLTNRRQAKTVEINYEKIAAIAISAVTRASQVAKNTYLLNAMPGKLKHKFPEAAFQNLRHLPKPGSLTTADESVVTVTMKHRYLEAHSV
jgi:predicted RNase H-like HicB family nuclease